MPGIDISQLTSLDDQRVDVAGRSAAAFAPPGAAFAAAPAAAGSSAAFRSPAAAFAPPAAAFAPAAALAPAGPAFAPPASAFAPPAHAFQPPGADEEIDEPLGVERSTRAIRIENQWQQHQRAAQQAPAEAPPPPAVAPRRSFAGIAIAVGLIAGVAGLVAALLARSAG